MGQQQQLLIALGMLLVGVAISTGLKMYEENMESAYLSQIEMDLQYLATKAQEYVMKPVHMSGGNGSFASVKGNTAIQNILQASFSYTTGKKNQLPIYNATYKVIKAGKPDQLQIQADGIIPLRNNKLPRYVVTITNSTYSIKRNR